MSRVGKMPVTIPAGVDVSIKEDQISVKGTGGTLATASSLLVKVNNDNGKMTFIPVNESREANAMSGTMRQLVNNMVTGVTKGFEKKLNLVGVGFKAQAQGAKLGGTVVKLTQKAGVDGRLFGSVTNADIAAELTKQGFAVLKSQIRMPNGPLKIVGDHPVSVALHTDVVVDVTVTVYGESA